MLAGERSLSGQTYLVRDVYFEPALGHTPQRLVESVQTRTRQGRASLIETHRFNFLRAQDASLAMLESGLNAALAACPTLHFMTPLELARVMNDLDPNWNAWSARLDEVPRFRRVARLTGLALPLAWLERAA